jgi:NhaP-type Na+/H+ and K+/H+ antiporter
MRYSIHRIRLFFGTNYIIGIVLSYALIFLLKKINSNNGLVKLFQLAYREIVLTKSNIISSKLHMRLI